MLDLIAAGSDGGALPAIASAYVSVRRRRRCRVSRVEGGLWAHRYAGWTLVLPEIGGATPEDLVARVRDEFAYDYSPQAGDVVVDVGAGIGSETLTFAPAVGPEGRVVAIEAHPRTAACLSRNVRVNGLENVDVLELAVADADATLVLGDDDQHLGNSVVRAGRRGVEVPARRLDDVLRDADVSQVALLKMNIEGAEVRALDGAARTLAATDHVVIACHDFLAAGDGDPQMRTKEAVRARLVEAGFAVRDREDDRPWVADTLYGRRREPRDERSRSE